VRSIVVLDSIFIFACFIGRCKTKFGEIR
jgi:hypothetical protein